MQNAVLTLGSRVRPESGHSLMLAGRSSEVMFAFSTNGSLIMLTVNCFVALMFCVVSFWPPLGVMAQETEITGGKCVTYSLKCK